MLPLLSSTLRCLLTSPLIPSTFPTTTTLSPAHIDFKTDLFQTSLITTNKTSLQLA